MKGKYLSLLLLMTTLAGCKVEGGFYSGVKKELTGEYISKEFTDLDASKLDVKNIHVRNGSSTYQVNVNIHNSTEKKVVVTAQENFFEDLVVKTSIYTLYINGKANVDYVTEHIDVDIYGYNFNEINLACSKGIVEANTLDDEARVYISGASEIEVKESEFSKLEYNVSGASELKFETIKTDNLYFDVSGASNLTVLSATVKDLFKGSISGASDYIINSLKANQEKIDLTGASKLVLKGEANSLKMNISGASKADLKENIVDEANIEISGASDASIYTKTSLTINASGASDVTYYGEGKLNEKSVSGGSEVKKGE